jgi:hypothetical protein
MGKLRMNEEVVSSNEDKEVNIISRTLLPLLPLTIHFTAFHHQAIRPERHCIERVIHLVRAAIGLWK